MNVPPKCFSNPANERRGWRKAREKERETKRFVRLFKRSLPAKESFNQPIISAKLKTNKLTWPPGPCERQWSHFITLLVTPASGLSVPPMGLSLVWSHRSPLSLPKCSVWSPAFRGSWALLLFPRLLNEDRSLICKENYLHTISKAD